jgi:hypothetical protein
VVRRRRAAAAAAAKDDHGSVASSTHRRVSGMAEKGVQCVGDLPVVAFTGCICGAELLQSLLLV